MADIVKVRSKDGTLIGSMKSGSGPPLLMVHGATTDHKSWARLTPRLQDDFTVYAMDRRGRGMSGDAPDYALQREAEDVAAVVASLGQPAFVFGHSFGGLCCLEGALLTNNIRKLVLYEPAVPVEEPSFSQDMLEKIQTRVEQGELEAAMEMFLRDLAQLSEDDLEVYRNSPLWEERLPLATTIPREMQVDTTYKFETERLAGLKTPVLLLQGSESPKAYRKGIERVHAALPESRVVLLEGQQHIAHHTDPDLLAGKLRALLLD